MRRFFGICFISVLAILGCKVAEAPLETDVSEESPKITPQILTLIFKIEAQDETVIPRVELSRKIIANGYLKNSKLTKSTPGSEYLLIQIFDFEDKILKQTVISHPLKKRYETTNDQGVLQSHEVFLQQEFFPVRLRNSNQLNSVKIFFIKAESQILLKHLHL